MDAYLRELREQEPERAAEGDWVQEQLRSRSAELEKAKTASGGGGGRHIGDFLPQSEFNRLLAKARPHTPGEQVFLDEDRPAIGADNIGYQILQRIGWDKDKGLGASRQGRRTPVAAAGQQQPLGIGARASGAVAPEPGDDPFTLYKKRMALSYRHRPNPNNAPRTPYWEDEKMNEGASKL